MHELDSALGEWELAAQQAAQFEFAFENPSGSDSETATETPFTEAEEMELAAELLTLRDETELDQFLGKLIKKAGKFVKGPLATVLKGVAKTALPIAGRVAGSFFGGPLGGALGSKLGSALSSALEVELEGFSPEEREFQAARQFVRFAGTAALRASRTKPGRHPWSAVRGAALHAAQRHLPSLLRRKRPFKRPFPPKKLPKGYSVPVYGAGAPGGFWPVADIDSANVDDLSTTGRWIKQGPKIVILNCYRNAPATTPPSIQISSSLTGDEGLPGDEGGESEGKLFYQPYPTFI